MPTNFIEKLAKWKVWGLEKLEFELYVKLVYIDIS